MGRLDNKVAVITGAASGIGLATATRFAGEGAAVVIGDLNQDGGEAAVRQCKENGGRAVFQKCNVESESDIKSLIDRAVREYGRLDIMFNNAGVGGALGSIEETSLEHWDKTQAVLLRAVFIGMKHAVPHMKRNGGGSIISTASVAGLRGGAGPHSYTAAKTAVIGLTRSVALEVGEHKIRVNCICPGGINTPMLANRFGGQQSAEVFLTQLQAIRRAGHPEDIANMALFLASDESQWITGTAMVVDGGMTAGGGQPANPAAQPSADEYYGPSFESKI
jgi:NAD(P)-dependent dehydrogenase (short-subunit alcohol dehydrogenase family)